MKKAILFLIAFICIHFLNAQTKSDSIYITPDIPASFVGGDSARVMFIINNLKTENLKIEAKLNVIYVQFVVEKSGKVSNAKILKGLNQQVDDEVLRMVMSMPKWTAAQYNKNIVRSQVIMPIKIKGVTDEKVIDTTYFNKDWILTTLDSAFYYRIRKSNGTSFNINYFFKNGTNLEQGEYSSISPEIKQGHFIAYYENGFKKSEYNCVNDTLQGESLDFYPSGKLKSKTHFLNNKKDGDFYEYSENDSLLRKKVFKAGYFVSCDGQEDSTDIYTKVDIFPEFPEGEYARQEFLAKNLKYPVDARESGIQGTVFTQFIVEKDGSITNIKVLRGIGGGCDEECLRIIKLMPKWNSGKEFGKSVRVRFVLPIKFSLN
jgi:TonB family protein